MRKAFLYIACVIALAFAACNEDTYEVFPEETSHLSANNAITASTIQGTTRLVRNINDILNWTGTGTNTSVLAIQWAPTDSVTPPQEEDILFLAWGYRWTSGKTGLDMIREVAANDPRLFVILTQQWGGWTIKGFGYDGNGDGKISISNSSISLTETNFNNGIYEGSADQDFDGMTLGNPADYWMGGWYKAYATYWLGTEGTTTPLAFDYSIYLVNRRTLSNNSWDAWTFSTINTSESNIDPRPDLLKAAPTNK